MRTLRLLLLDPPPPARAAHGGAGPSAPRRPPRAAAGHRPPRRLRLPARAHARLLPPRRRAGRRLHRARPRLAPRTACSSPATSPRSAAPPTSPTTPSSPPARPPRSIDGVSVHRLVHRGLHARRAQDAARQGAPAGHPPAQHALRRPLRDPDLPGGPRPARAALARAAPPDRRLPRDQAPDLLPLDRPAARGAARAARCDRNGLDRRGAPVFVQSFEIGNLQALDQQLLKVPLVQLLDAPTLMPGDVLTRRHADLRRDGDARPACASIADVRRRRRAVEGLHHPARRADGLLGQADLACRATRTAPASTSHAVHVPRREPVPAARAALVAGPRRRRRPVSARSASSSELGIDGFFTDNADYGVRARS